MYFLFLTFLLLLLFCVSFSLTLYLFFSFYILACRKAACIKILKCNRFLSMVKMISLEWLSLIFAPILRSGSCSPKQILPNIYFCFESVIGLIIYIFFLLLNNNVPIIGFFSLNLKLFNLNIFFPFLRKCLSNILNCNNKTKNKSNCIFFV